MRPERYDSAVLFVHGIGQQRRGATLGEFGGSLVDSARTWYGVDNVHDIPSGLPRTDDTPEHRAVLVSRPGREPLRLLLAESHWANDVEAPRWGALMGWLASTVPFLVQRALDAGMRRSSRRLDASESLLAELGLGALRVVQNVLAVALALFVLVFLLAVGLLAGVAPVRERLFGAGGLVFPTWARALALASLAPIGYLVLTYDLSGPQRTGLLVAATIPAVVLLSLSGRLRSLVVGFIGDSYALLHEDGPRSAIVGRVRHDLGWLEAGAAGAPTVIVAHSQGAEVARRALAARSVAGPPLAGLVTFGSGIAKLHAVDRLRDQRGRSFGAFALRILSAALACMAAAVALGGLDLGPAVYATALAAVALFGAAALALSAARRQLQQIVGMSLEGGALQIDARQVAHWTDLHASHDPVSEGDLPVGQCTRGFSRTVVNRRSMLLDHVAYWHNLEGFQATVALEIERATTQRANPSRPLVLAHAERARTKTICAIDRVRLPIAALVPALWFGLDASLLGGALIGAGAIGLLVGVSKLLDVRARACTQALITVRATDAAPRPMVAA